MKGGIVHSKTWDKDIADGVCRRVLVILKEAPCRENFQLEKALLKDGSRGNTYNNAAMWVFLISHYKRDDVNTSLNEALKKKTHKGRSSCLKHSAVINISDAWQKSAGGKRTNDKTLFDNHTEERQKEIESYIDTIKPDIILCGGKVVVKCLHKFRGKKVKLSTTTTKYAKAYAYRIGDYIYPLLSMPHPNAPIDQKMMYKDLEDLLNEIQLP